MRPRALLLLALLALACAEPHRHPLRDDLGRAVAVPQAVTRVVTLAPNLTEIVYAIGAGKKIVATDSFSDTPPAAKMLPKVGGVPPNIERIAAARPDLVLAITSGGEASVAQALASVHIPVYFVRTDRIDDVPRAMRSLGKILGAPDAERVAESLRRGIDSQRRRRSPAPRVLFAIWTDPLYVAGRGTFGDDLISLTGGENIVRGGGWPQYSLESVVADPPDLILYPDKSVQPAAIESLFRSAPELRKHAVAVPVDENRFTRPGPHLVEAAAELNRILDRRR